MGPNTRGYGSTKRHVAMLLSTAQKLLTPTPGGKKLQSARETSEIDIVYIYIYIYMYVHIYVYRERCVYIYIYI